MPVSKIYAIDSVQLTLAPGNSAKLVVSVLGRVASTGWTEPQLSPYVYVTPPSDGVQEFDFLAKPPQPDTITLPVLTPTGADYVFDPVDIEAFWGQGKPLLGVRIHSVANTKEAPLNEHDNMPGPRVMAAESLVSDESSPETKPGFEADIKPLFRIRDVACMRTWFDLHNYDDVTANAEAISERLSDGTMPTDGPWPAPDVELFKEWKDGGMAP